jgi:predicted  nucleic acid-binding Zn-ribbon protein
MRSADKGTLEIHEEELEKLKSQVSSHDKELTELHNQMARVLRELTHGNLTAERNEKKLDRILILLGDKK